MKVIIDIECNALVNPSKIWLIVCKDVDTKEVYIFRNVTEDKNTREAFVEFTKSVDCWIGHHILGYDLVHIDRLLDTSLLSDVSKCIDTLIISKLADYSKEKGHSVEAYGEEFGFPKGVLIEDNKLIHSSAITQSFFDQYSLDLENYCLRDVEISYRIYQKYAPMIGAKEWQKAIELEHKFQLLVNDLEQNGFSFNVDKAKKLLTKVEEELNVLDRAIMAAFPPRLKLIREVTPRVTKHGTIAKNSIPKALGTDYSCYTADAPFCYCSWQEFNPSSHKQLIEVLWEAGWSPKDKTKTHLDTLREVNSLKYRKNKSTEVDIRLQECYTALEKLGKNGWKINETNLDTLPIDAPAPARTLAKRILLEARRRTLTEWLSLVQPDSRIHGDFYGIGAWTHRMAHQRPNTANIPREYKEDGSPKLLGKELRSLWQAPRNRLLVGVDAEGIQLRIFAHYIDDAEFTKALVEGKKDDKTDPHSLNQRILGDVCKTRQAAKRFIYALLLGAGIGKLAEILGTSENETKSALARLMARYQGFTYLKEQIIPADAKRGWFLGLDGRRVIIPGLDIGERKHLCMSGYLQNGEAIIMKMGAVKWNQQIRANEELNKAKILFINMVHDEWQTEVPNNMEIALKVAKLQSDVFKEVGEELKLKCPLAGSYFNDDIKDYTIGTNWYQTH